MKKKLFLLAIVATVLLSAAPVLADDGFYVVAVGGGVGTKITSLPKTIDTPGFYYVTGNLSCPSGNGITVNADNVTIDLMGFCLSGNSSSNGIYMFGRKNVEIRNGTLRGWYIAIFESASALNHRVINVRAAGNTFGIQLAGYSHLIKGCTASDNTDSGITAWNSKATGNLVYNCGHGINNTGGTCSNNVVQSCSLYGIYANGTISGNTVSNISSSGTGIYCSAAGSVIGNTVFTGIGQTGINLSTSTSDPIIMDQNTVCGPGTHYSGGSSATVWAGKSTFYPYGNNAGAP